MSMLDIIAWREDLPEANEEFRKELSAVGVDTEIDINPPDRTTLSVSGAGVRLIVDNKFDVSRPTEGTDFAVAMLERDDCRIVVYSGFLDSAYRQKALIKNSKSKSAVLFAPKPTLETPDVKMYLKELASVVRAFLLEPWEQISTIKLPGSITVPHKRIGFSEFEVLTLKEKKPYYNRFKTECDNVIEHYFESGAIWMLFAGFSQEPFRVAYSVDEILAPQEVSAVCRKLDVVPFIFRNDVRIDSIRCELAESRGQSNASIATYPFAIVGFSTNRGEDLLMTPMHFDTGADVSLLNNDFVSEFDVSIEARHSFGEFPLHGKDHLADEITLSILLENDGSSPLGPGKYFRSVRAVAIDDWEHSSLHLKCNRACEQKGPGNTCILRKSGLLGRSVYRGSAPLNVFVDASTCRVSFSERVRP